MIFTTRFEMSHVFLHQYQDCNPKLRQNTKNEADPLKVLSEASSALALTETLIGESLSWRNHFCLDDAFIFVNSFGASCVNTARGYVGFILLLVLII